MKRILCFALSCILLLTISTCGSPDHNGQPADIGTSSLMPEESSQTPSDEIQDAPEQSQSPIEEQPQTEPNVPSAESKPPAASAPPQTEPPKSDNSMVTIQIIAGDKTFSATLYNTQTTQAFTKQMPLTATMDELNGNEKFYYLSNSLPTDSFQPEEIKAGDLMLYGSDCLVLFYESFSTSYSYTRLGYVESPDELSAALGSGSTSVTFLVK